MPERRFNTNKDQERITLRETKLSHMQEIELLTGVVNTFISGFNLVGSFEISQDNEAQYLWLNLLARSTHSLRCALDLSIKGYYSQAMSLLRAVTEDWLICKNVESTDVVRDYLLRDKGRIPSYETLARNAQATKVYDELYRYQCKFTHSSGLSLGMLQDQNENTLRIAPAYDEQLFLGCAELFVRVSLLMMQFMHRLLQYIGEDKATLWATTNLKRVQDTNDWLEGLTDHSSFRADVTKNHQI